MRITFFEEPYLETIRKGASQDLSIMNYQQSGLRGYFLSLGLSVSTQNPLSSEPISACSQDYGFDIDEDELASGLLAPAPGSLLDRSIDDISADDFDSLYKFFCS